MHQVLGSIFASRVQGNKELCLNIDNDKHNQRKLQCATGLKMMRWSKIKARLVCPHGQKKPKKQQQKSQTHNSIHICAPENSKRVSPDLFVNSCSKQQNERSPSDPCALIWMVWSKGETWMEQAFLLHRVLTWQNVSPSPDLSDSSIQDSAFHTWKPLFTNCRFRDQITKPLIRGLVYLTAALEFDKLEKKWGNSNTPWHQCVSNSTGVTG